MTTQDPGAPSNSISGTIKFEGVDQPRRNVTLYVRVQDTSRADAPAVTVAEQVFRGVEVAPGSPPIHFTVQGIPHNERAPYTVRVHADVDGTGVVSKGDYVSTESYPVQTGDQPAPVTIVARPVR
jgi:putative lipoprotein